ncbi:MAG: NADH-quinone oxidoreductase subunit J [Myxococcales bacterium]|nr:NADH-quinone oxidoreductase subunit J [Myxococcales bacterium]
MRTGAAALLLVGVVLLVAGVASAQPGPGPTAQIAVPRPGGGVQLLRIDGAGNVDAVPAVATDAPDDMSAPAPTGKGAAFAFWLFSAIVVGGAIFTITRRNAVTAVMSLVGTFIGIAAIYAMLFAHFLAAIQVLVYAGAIMVLFVFVVMLLNKEEEEPFAFRGVIGKVLSLGAIAYLGFRLITLFWRVKDDPTLTEAAWQTGEFAAYGTTKGVGQLLFTDYLFPFEAVSIVLLVAVIGALVLAHPEHVTAGEPEPEPAGKPPGAGAGAVAGEAEPHV